MKKSKHLRSIMIHWMVDSELLLRLTTYQVNRSVERNLWLKLELLTRSARNSLIEVLES